MNNRYSLADYILSISFPDDFASKAGLLQSTIEVGGEGSYLDSMNVSLDNQLWTTEGDSTGSWVHNKNLSRTGKVTISLNQLSTKVAKFKEICKLYYSVNDSFSGAEVTLRPVNSNEDMIVRCKDCYFTKIPDQSFQSTAQMQTWELTCGQITF